MKALRLSIQDRQELEAIYASIALAYDQAEAAIQLSCLGCPDNCCDSYFLHYTYCEWAYLWLGMRELAADTQQTVLERARQYSHKSRMLIQQGKRPQLMCPLNEAGRCMLYAQRLMICRAHGVPATLTRADGQLFRFPGCFRCQELVSSRYPDASQAPAADRTALYQRLAQLERRVLAQHDGPLPKIRLTIADMLVQGPPPGLSC